MLRTVGILFLPFIYFGGVTSLRDVQLRVEPPVVKVGETATLICSRDIESGRIYTVKWYRGNFDFYRYVPHNANPGSEIQMFAAPGLQVDLNRSNGSQVFLKRLNLSLAGEFKCEVTTEFPYTVQSSTAYLDVVAVPKKDPDLKADKERYLPGERLKANCTCYPSKPAANLTIYVNDEPIQSLLTSFTTDDGLVSTRIAAELKLSSKMFNQGRLRLKCEAIIYNVYNGSAFQDFFTPENDPRTERITSNTAGRTLPRWIFLFLLMLLPLVAMGQLDDYTFNDNTFDGFMYYDDDIDQNKYLSLVGG